ncbi:MAG TPA: FHA domain-containing protein [Polyangia bacterium]|nr:FHA domain-containing protein [Polyangia bacterium]
MPRCSHCGKVNREGSLFCQDCGHRLEAAPAPKAAAAGGTTCSACGTVNPPGMNFCKMCGTSLMAKPAQAPIGMASTVAATAEPVAAPAPQPAPQQGAAKAICPACGKGTPVGFAFCQHCGQRLSPSAPGAAPPSVRNAPAQPVTAPGGSPANVPPASQAQPMGVNTMGVASTMAAMSPSQTPGVTPTPPAGMPRSQPISSAPAPAQPRVAQPVAAGVIGSGGNGHAPNDAFAQTMAPNAASLEMLEQVRNTGARAAALPSTTQPDMPAAPKLQTTHGTLVAVNRDGSDGRTIEIAAETFDIGRSEGSLHFADDPYLAARHARLVVQSGKVMLRPLDGVNGVFVRVQSCDLAPGDSFLVGKELLRYEPLGPEERELPSLMEHGVRIFGSAPREAWGRLRQLTIAGTARDVWHLTRPELVLGREEGDVTFPDDEFMSRRHAAVKRVGTKARLEDLGSSNGTFVRVRADRELKPGDLLRLGDQLLRYEP